MQKLADHVEVTQLLARYAFALDGFDSEGVADCFARDGAWISPSGAAHGRDAIRELMSRRTPKPGECRRHYLLNPLITLEGDRGKLRAYLQVTVMRDGAVQLILTGEYRAEVVNEDGQWKFSRREAVTDTTST